MSIRLDPVVLARLRQFRQRRFRLLTLRGFAAGIVSFLLAMSIVAVIDWHWLLTTETRWTLSIVAYGLVGVVVWVTSLRRLVHRPGRDEIARQVEDAEPALRENLLSAIELAVDDPSAIHDSPVFRSLLQGKVAQLMGTIHVPTLLPFRLVTRWLLAAVVLVGVVAFLLTSGDQRFRQLATRALLPGANVARVSRIQVEILQPTPHSLTLAEDDTVAVVAAISGGEVDEVILETFSERHGSTRQNMHLRNEQQFAANIHVADESVEYRILAGDAVTQRYRIASAPRPHVLAFHKTWRYPEYAMLDDTTVTEANGDLIVLEGSTAMLTLELDQEVSTAELRIDPADSDDIQVIPLAPASGGGSTNPRWTASVPVDQRAVYKVHLVSKKTGFENLFSPRYEIRPQPDLIPRVGFVDQQQQTLLLPPNDILALKGMAEDDLPVVSMEQQISVNGREWESLALETHADDGTQGRQLSANWQWDLLNHRLKTGDQVLTRLAATDRKGNRGESIPIRIVVAAADFNPQRHAAMRDKSALYDDLAAFAAVLEEHRASALEIIERLKQTDRPSSDQELDRTTLRDLTIRQRDQADQLMERVREVGAVMAPGADAFELDLTGRVVARLQLEHAGHPAWLLQAVSSADSAEQAGRDQINRDLDALQRSFERSADDAKNLAAHYQHLLTHNLLNSLAFDLDALLRQQTFVVDSPTQTWERLLRQESVVINQLKEFEGLIHDQRSTVSSSTDGQLRNLLNWSERLRQRLEETTESEDQLPQLQNAAKDTLTAFQQQQRVDAMDGGLPGRLVGAWRDLENRGGSLYVPIDELAKAIQQENRLTAQAVDSDDSTESGRLRNESERYMAEIDLKHQASISQLQERRQLTQMRKDSDARYAADAGLTHRAVRSELNQHRRLSPAESAVADHLLEIAPAYRTLEAGHDLIVARDILNLLVENEHWHVQSLQAHADHPRQWDLVQQALEMASRHLSAARIDNRIVGAVDQARWSANVREAGRKIGERRWKRDLMVGAAHELTRVRDEVNTVVQNLQPAMTEARAIIAKYAPSLAEIARQAAEDLRAMEKETTTAADHAEQPDNSEQTRQDLAELQQQQDDINQQIEDLFDALVEDANTQDLLDDQERERARDADDSIAMIRDPAAQMNRALEQAQQDQNAKEQASDLAKAAEQQERTAQALDLVAEHFERLDEGLDVADSREQLRQMEQDSSLAEQAQQQFDATEQLADMARQDAEQLMQQLEAELQRNPAMQAALSEISQNTLEDAREALEYAATDDQELRRANERADEQFQQKKKNLVEDLRELGNQASQLSSALVAHAVQAAAAGKAPEAQKKFSETQQKLNEAVAAANSAREELLLSDLAQAAQQTREAIEEATAALKQAQQETKEKRNEEIHADDKAKLAAKNDAERRRQQQRDQQKRNAQNDVRQADAGRQRADQAVRNAENQLKNAERQVEQATQSLNRKPDDVGLQQQLAQRQANQATEERRLEVAQAQQARAEQRQQQAKQRAEKVNARPTPPLHDANPAAQLANDYAEEAIETAEQLKEKAGSLAEAADFGSELAPPASQLASAQERQSMVTEDVQNVANDVARAARHERRLNNPAASEPLHQTAAQIEQVAQNESGAAEQQLKAATAEARLADGDPGTGQPPQARQNGEALEAQQSIADTEAAIRNQAEQLDAVIAPLLAAAAAQANQNFGEPAGPPDSGAPNAAAPNVESAQAGQPQNGSPPNDASQNGAPQQSPAATASFTPEELARGQQLARTLDELDRIRAQAAPQNPGGEENGPPQPASPLALQTLAQAARNQQAALAAQRQQSQQQALASLTEGQSESADNPADSGQPTEFEVTSINRQENTDWGRLRSKSAEDLTKGRSEAVSEAYRRSVEAYFRVLSERARNQKK
ncbi:MAG: hypothetical protein KDA96_10755 [Planctomycetaceae bacterium]|nr:hypothetical protein [Planctomycetaceae bacterium]